MKLKIVGLPIGNIEDISLRALRTLKETKFIVCEDSRMFNSLWMKLKQMSLVDNFSGRIKFINDFNEYKSLPRLLEEMDMLEEAVLVSDAGMPLISDPGYKMVSEGIARGWEVSVVPGPTAESAALAVSGLPTDKYLFLGFLPRTSGKRKTMLENTKKMQELQKFSVVIYESANRLERLLPDLKDVFGDEAKICLAVDLTKISEKIIRGNLRKVIERLKELKGKGEVTIVLSA
ncbi:16S rRNA (cytidine(1402)-2'-O)-methyltransferase [Candidatus Collierbacteria bacterium RIFOXYD1_FULL_40_9]|uniref:Ribosomal RNA small subunit methyltransferase I n=1 Tax=Candidatus Collierbacteria bacterium RIFOXYD1_FULL_40_9 TaxID=1817731 RepID=A0A1F5FPP2_9BACT|nr:MAG: 16S rRNA (cytidine(1402)-2'-O)-methyltransferase [Candidatus Collierbacteria bacterium RIFOXYD1_FULL_40_9]